MSSAWELLGNAARLISAVASIALPRHEPAEQTVVMPDAEGPIEVNWDRWGVPHVSARTEHDAWRAQGYLHARDRLWQMELQRRLGHGQLAELFGPEALPGDRFVRAVGLSRVARGEAADLPAATEQVIASYVAGVNSYLAGTRRLPFEFGLLGHRPQPWTTADVLVWGKAMALAMGANWEIELLRARIVDAVGPDRAAHYDLGLPAEQYATVRDWGTAPTGMPPLDRSLHGQGSNAWAVTGPRSSDGAPLLACDPHLKVQLPAPWYENHLAGGDLHVTGASLPGAPGVLIGHNEHVAWGITSAKVDVQDLFEERLDGAGHYLYRDEWRAIEQIEERITVRGQDEPHVERVRATGHGPLVDEFLGAAAARAAEERSGLALCWVGSEPGETVSSVLALNHSRDCAQVRAALAGWTAPSQVFVYADVHGGIGSALAGRVPVRGAGDGSVPVPGWTGDYDWRGLLAADDLPATHDPVDGTVVAANNRVADETYPHALPGEWTADYRAGRIARLLADEDRHDVASFAAIQNDLVSVPGLALAALAERLPAQTPQQRAARAALAAWDGMLSADSAAGAIYSGLRAALLRTAYAELAQPLELRVGGGLFTWTPGSEFLDYAALPTVLRRLSADDDGWLLGDRTWQAVLCDAWRTAIDQLVERLGPDVSRWRYGEMHEMRLRHPFGGLPLLGGLVNRGPYPHGGDADTVCAANLITDADGTQTFDTASYRMICALGNWDRSVSVLPTGQSGRPGERHYADQTALWLRGEYHPMCWTTQSVRRESVRHALLIPPRLKKQVRP